jgi:CDP-diacylglycerol--serine O-phosphatidyltransferase
MPRSRSWVALPTSLTLANALCGFMAMQQLTVSVGPASRATAAWWILAGWIFDLLDGPAARWANAIGPFGREMDALSDALTFGAAAGLLVATSGTGGARIAGALVLAAVVLRLARFAAAADDSAHLWFAGLPSPASAALIASLTLVDAHYPGAVPPLAWPFAAVVLSALMVSRLPYADLPKHLVRGTIPRWPVIPLAALLLWRPTLTLLAAWGLYVALSPLVASRFRSRPAPPAQAQA